jgi:hypothetical protein
VGVERRCPGDGLVSVAKAITGLLDEARYQLIEATNAPGGE